MVFAERGRDRCRGEVFENQDAAAQQEAWLFGSATCDGQRRRRNKNPRKAHRRKSDTDVSPGRYLRGRVRSLHSVLLFDLRRRERAARKRKTEGYDSGRWTEPDRAGYRV